VESSVFAWAGEKLRKRKQVRKTARNNLFLWETTAATSESGTTEEVTLGKADIFISFYRKTLKEQ